jgi:hypothetical protein
MPTISVKIEGLDAVINFTKQVSIRLPRESNKLNEKMAKNTEMMAKTFLRKSYSGKRTVPRRGWLESSILAYQQRPTEWRVKVGPTPYAMVQEYGKTWQGRRFIPALGYGRISQEGYSIKSPGDSIVVPGKHFMENAVRDTENKVDKMIEETVKEVLR